MELLDLYCAVMYLFAIGMSVGSFEEAKKDGVLSGLFLTLIFAPMLIPVIFGMLFIDKNYDS